MAILKKIGRMLGRGYGLALLVVWLLVFKVDPGMVLCPTVSAQPDPTPEYKVKAAFLYNFAILTEWPEGTFTNATQPLVIGVVGRDPFGSLLEDTFRGKTIEGRPIEVVRFARPRDITSCHLLFVPASEESRLSSVLSHVSGQPVLTVGDGNQFAWRGGIIGLVNKEGEIRFDINLAAAKKAGVKLSSKMLRLANSILPTAKEKGD